jgi:hypothetical protein
MSNCLGDTRPSANFYDEIFATGICGNLDYLKYCYTF